MKILLTGATSGLGRNAAEHLLVTGHDVVAIGRNPAQGEQLQRMGATFVPRDLTTASVEECIRLVEGCDAVWHCAAKSSPWGRRADFWLTNVQVTQRLAQAAGTVQVPRFIHISTPAVYFDFQHHYDLTENYRARRFSSHYAHSKQAAEQVITDAVARFASTTWVILRPRGLFGPHDNVIVPRLLQQLRRDNGVLRLPRGGEALLDLTFVQNVVYAMELATRRTLRSGSVYNVTNHQPQRLRTMLDALLREQLGLHYQIRNVPWPVLSLAARGMEIFGHCLNKEPPVTRYSAGTVCFDMTLSAHKAIEELGYRPRYSMEDGIALTGKWMREHGHNHRL
ncbi:NAD(P)-dependent oxidoreductase [Superficieibacter sp. HKU1]|uniref:NAD-dependent epimerase/dehydratase family protein n=1 Tax=Superficieibacter sp. HKU1 TaxID=3031919 RepID=UPI0023E0A18E|nr:NAD(P)-dependent oxidoreductase [Superficieibacter sp. HKU1]WES66441.1 NAD(P)-dependent oxidoreductase [Superficieibacter sp. HKU1]